MRIHPDLLVLGSLLGAFACQSGESSTPARSMPNMAPPAAVANAGSNAAQAGNAGTASGGRPASAAAGTSSPGAAGSGSGAAGDSATTPPVMNAGNGASAGAGGAVAAPVPNLNCAPRMVSGEPALHFHHIHFNSTEPDKDIEFFAKFHNGKTIDFCKDAAKGTATKAIQTERGYFLFTDVEMPPDPALNSHLEHVGYVTSDPGAELRRMMGLGVTLWPPGDNLQCEEVTMGRACFMNGYFYTKTPSGARIEVAGNPKPPTSGFGHIHLRGEISDFFPKVLGPSLMGVMDTASYQAKHVDQVNLTNIFLEMRPPENPVESKGKPIDHIAYSTTDLTAHLERVKGMNIEIAEDISFKPEYGFKSFFLKSPEGVWVEIVEDSQFKP